MASMQAIMAALKLSSEIMVSFTKIEQLPYLKI